MKRVHTDCIHKLAIIHFHILYAQVWMYTKFKAYATRLEAPSLKPYVVNVACTCSWLIPFENSHVDGSKVDFINATSVV